jgi:hypothetical protein
MAVSPTLSAFGRAWLLKIKGQWVYLYRAADKVGRTVDFLLSRRRDMAAATRFFSRATKQHGAPRVITLDGYAASHQAVVKLKASGILRRRVQVRSCKYLNNVIEQDHRRIKQRVRPMRGFNRFETAAVTIRGIELAEKIKKQQFNLKPLTGKATNAPEILGGGPGRLKSASLLARHKHTLSNICTRTVAPTLRSLIIQIDGFARSSRTTSEGTSCFLALTKSRSSQVVRTTLPVFLRSSI